MSRERTTVVTYWWQDPGTEPMFVTTVTDYLGMSPVNDLLLMREKFPDAHIALIGSWEADMTEEEREVLS